MSQDSFVYDEKWKKIAGESEEDNSLTLTYLTFYWVSPMLSRGYDRVKEKTMLLTSDLLGLPKVLDVRKNYAAFLKEWDVVVAEAEAAKPAALEAFLKKNPDATQEEIEAATPKPKLAAALRRSIGGNAKVGAVFRGVADIFGLFVPFVIQYLVEWMSDYSQKGSTRPLWEGFVTGLVLVFSQLIFAAFTNFSHHFTIRSFLMARDVLTVAIYEKAMKLDASNRLGGKIITMHSTDTFKMIEMGVFVHGLWSSPIVIIAALAGLYFFIGPAGLLSLAVMIVLTPVQGIVSSKLMTYRTAINAATDERMKAVRELLTGIRIIKFMNWESELERKIDEKRDAEVANFKPLFVQRSILITMIAFIPQVVMFTVFAAAYGFGREINAQTVFPVISMLNILRLPLAFLPLAIGKLIDVSVSFNRISDFLISPERVNIIEEFGDGEQTDVAVEIRNADLQVLNENDHSQRVTILHECNLEIPKDKLTIVVGATGAGKSTLINAIAGEGLISDGGSIIREGDIAYVPQEAWIMNATVRDNILMGREYDEAKYLATCNACQLMSDFDNLAASDQTEIGERGINLSGGQKQRIAFARAVYSGIPLVLMDDPLSAVDAHVRVALFEDVIRGQLEGRTRVLVTHYVEYLQEADHIVVIQDRKIAFSGSWDQLLTQKEIDLSELTEAAQTPGSSTPGAQPALMAAMSPGGNELRLAEIAKNREERQSKYREEIPEPRKEGDDKLMDEETQAVGIISGRVYSWYFGYVGCCLISVILFLFILWRAMTLVADSMISLWATRTAPGGLTLSETQYLYIYAITVFLSLFVIGLRQIPYVAATVRVAEQTHGELVKRVMHCPMSVFDTTPLGRIINRFSKDMEAMDLVIPDSMNFFLQMVMVILGAVAIMIAGAPFVAIILLILAIVFVLLVRFYSATNRALKRVDGVNRSPVLSTMAESMGGLTTLRAYDIVSQFSANHTSKVLTSSRSTNSWLCAARWLNLRSDLICFVSNISMAYIIIGLLSWYEEDTREEQLPLMSLGLVTSVAIGGALSFLATMSADLEAAMSSIERVQEYAEDLEQEKTVEYGKDGVPAKPDQWPSTGKIKLDNVSLRYRPGLPLVLQDLSVTFPHGEKIGIVGRTGSGKSTIMLALFRIVELAQGSITIDEHDISNLQLSDLRSQITIIPQDPLLFEGSIRSNLDPFNNHSDEELCDALRTVDLYNTVVDKVVAAAHSPKGGASTRNSAKASSTTNATTPGSGKASSTKNEPIVEEEMDIKPLECVVDERGSNFSVGQRQLLCLARAMMKKSKILLLDEATASVDFESDELIQRTVRREFAGCTILTIAHRLATVMDYDKILVLDKGRVGEYDHPRRLLAKVDGIFHSMVASQGDEQFEILKSKTTEPPPKADPFETTETKDAPEVAAPENESAEDH